MRSYGQTIISRVYCTSRPRSSIRPDLGKFGATPKADYNSSVRPQWPEMQSQADHVGGRDPSRANPNVYPVPMSKEREPALQAYDMVAEKASILYQAGKRIAITAEGDAGIYSSSGYILGRLNDLGVETVRTAGIPAFVAAAALAKVILTEGEESLLIPSVCHLGQASSFSDREWYDSRTNEMLTINRCNQEAIHQGPHLSWHYFESIGYSRRIPHHRSTRNPISSLSLLLPDHCTQVAMRDIINSRIKSY